MASVDSGSLIIVLLLASYPRMRASRLAMAVVKATPEDQKGQKAGRGPV
ncbi:hypothetical protein [Pseudofrankia asymbiotica]|nr:hypothetical protein [Pseudofrankia asymbiotica]